MWFEYIPVVCCWAFFKLEYSKCANLFLWTYLLTPRLEESGFFSWRYIKSNVSPTTYTWTRAKSNPTCFLSSWFPICHFEQFFQQRISFFLYQFFLEFFFYDCSSCQEMRIPHYLGNALNIFKTEFEKAINLPFQQCSLSLNLTQWNVNKNKYKNKKNSTRDATRFF